MLSGSMVEASALSGSKYWAAHIIYIIYICSQIEDAKNLVKDNRSSAVATKVCSLHAGLPRKRV